MPLARHLAKMIILEWLLSWSVSRGLALRVAHAATLWRPPIITPFVKGEETNE